VAGLNFSPAKNNYMTCSPYTNLQATPDFSTFQFTSPTPTEPVIRQVRFTGQKDGLIYHLDLRDRSDGRKDNPSRILDIGDMDNILATLIEIIEIYTERYPRRVIRLKGNTWQKVFLYREALDRYADILCPLFTIDMEARNSSTGPGSDPDSISFLLKRKPIPYLTIHSIHSTWKGLSRLFEKKFSIELDKTIRVGLTMPTV
jgi:hypothetical protein